MVKRNLRNVLRLTTMLLSFSFSALASESESEHGDKKSLKEEIKADINHHLKDSYDFHLFTDKETGTHYSFPLPVIIIDDGLKVFMSSSFHHGEELAKEKYFVHHGHIYMLDKNGKIHLTETREEENEKGQMVEVTDTIQSLTYSEFKEQYHHEGHVSLPKGVHVANERPIDISITKNVLLITLISGLLFWMLRSAARSYRKIGGLPSGIGRFIEPIVLFVRDEIAKPNIGEKHYKRYMSYLLTIFFFIWLVNLFGLTPLGVNITNSIAVTFVLAIMTYLITTFTAKKDYWKHIFWMPGVPVPMKIVLAPIELLGTFIKPFSLMIRLYANITAGHIVIMSIIGMMFIFQSWMGSSLSFLLAVVLGILELLVAALQAYIFTMLSALYFGSAVEEHDDH